MPRKEAKVAKVAKKQQTAKPQRSSRKVFKVTKHPGLVELVVSGLALQKVAGQVGAPAAGLFTDPYAEAASDRMEEKLDHANFQIESALCPSEDQYSGAKAFTGKPFRVGWALPLAEITTVGRNAKIDQRGLLTDVLSARVIFTNLTDDTIKIRANCPRAYRDTDGIGTRDSNVSRDLGPHAKTSVTVRLGYSPLFSPFCYVVKDADGLGLWTMVLLDFICIKPNISLETGESYVGERALCRVDVEVKYDTNTDPREGTDTVYRTPFCLQQLPNLAALFKVDAINAVPKSYRRAFTGHVSPTIVQLPRSGFKWLRAQMFRRKDTYGYCFRLVFCDRHGAYQAPVHWPAYETGEVRLILLGDHAGFTSHWSGTVQPTATHFGTHTFRYDDVSESWVTCTGLDALTSDIDEPGPQNDQNVLPATTPFVVYSMLPPSVGKTRTLCRGGQAITTEEDPDQLGGAIADVLQWVVGNTDTIALMASVLSIFV